MDRLPTWIYDVDGGRQYRLAPPDDYFPVVRYKQSVAFQICQESRQCALRVRKIFRLPTYQKELVLPDMVIYFNPELDTLICKDYCHFLKLKLASLEVNVFKTSRRPEASVLLDQCISPEFLRIVKTMTFDDWPW